MNYHETILVEWLERRCKNIYSQFGEDGLIEATFETIGTTNKQCFEVGAGDGIQFSNTRALVERGWQAMWIEHYGPLFGRLLSKKPPSVVAVREKIVPENVNDLFANLPRDIDFGVIDIDGDDYWIWQAMSAVVPRVMLIEYSPYLENQERLPERGPERERQAPLGPIRKLGEDKGYQLLATTFCNALFARSDTL